MTVYRSGNVTHAVTAALAEVERHRLDPVTGLCGACRSAAPCEAANSAVNFILDTGVPLPTTAPMPGRPLLTHGWRVLFGLVPGPARSRSAQPGTRWFG